MKVLRLGGVVFQKRYNSDKSLLRWVLLTFINIVNLLKSTNFIHQISNSRMKAKILVIDDEESLCEILQFNLIKEGFQVDTAYSAEEALEMNLDEYDLFLCDIMMGELSGFDFAERVRSIPALENKPIIFCSALGDEDDKVNGLNIGADDYVTKPFVISEVVARVRAVLRRAERAAAAAAIPGGDLPDYMEPDITYRGLRIDPNQKICYLNGEELQLTPTEFDILTFFLTHRNRIYSREEIITKVWGDDRVVTTRAIDTNLTRLRGKIGDYGANIITRPGFGYGFKETH